MKFYSLAFWLLFQFPFACNEALEWLASSPRPDSQRILTNNKSGAVNIVFRSTDGGQTWQDMSEGLPKPVQDDYGIYRGISFANDNGLYLTAGNVIYHSKPNATAPFWEKESFPDQHSSITPGKTGLVAYNYNGQFLQKINGTSVWSPMYPNFPQKRVRTVFETAGGTMFIGSDNGLFKSTNSGETWK